MYAEIGACRICGERALEPAISLGSQALTGVFPKSAGEEVPAGPLELVFCGNPACGLVQLRHSYEPDAMYGDNYGYRSGLNGSMVRHLGLIAERLIKASALGAGDLALDIGSNDGTLLRALGQSGCELVGMDPTAAKFRQYYPEHASVLTERFSAAGFHTAFPGRRPKVVASVAMFYDLESPVTFAREVAEILADDGVWLIEQSYLPTMLRRVSYDTICHEHLEYYALKQIVWIADHAGLVVKDVSFNDINGGSFAVAFGRRRGGETHAPIVARVLDQERTIQADLTGAFRAFRRQVERSREKLVGLLSDQRSQGRLVLGYGASTKGNVVLQYCGLGTEELPCIAEVNPEKFGAFTPGTRIPIVSEAEAKARRPASFLVLPWHFREFFLERESAFLAGGGNLIFPLPNVEAVGSLIGTKDLADGKF